MKRLTATFLCLLALGLLAGCGDDDDDSEPVASDTETTTSDTTTDTTTTDTTTTETTSTETSTIEDDTGLPEQRCSGAESPPNITDVISYGADCGAVEDAMAEIRSISREFRIGDFECARASGSALSGVWECRGEASYFTFTFAD